jgi:hypothetical protein
MTAEYDQGVSEKISELGVSRLVHFTPSRNLPQILGDGALRGVSDLDTATFAGHARNDSVRADGHPDKLSMSFEYPNVYYLRLARGRTSGFQDWACLVLNPRVAAIRGALFSPINAASWDASLRPGAEGMSALWEDDIPSSRRLIRRSPDHRPASPTDLQAEVMIPGPIPLSEVIGIVVPRVEDAHLEQERLRYLRRDPEQLDWIVSAEMFEIGPVLRAVRQNRQLTEIALTRENQP